MNRTSPWIYLRYLVLPVLVVGGTMMGGYWNYMIPVTCFIIHPLLNLNKRNTPKSEIPSIYSRKDYKWAALSFVPVLVGVTVFEIVSFGSVDSLTATWFGAVLSTGIMNGILGFTLAHEFIHRHNSVENFAGYLLLLQNSYLHYSIEHIGGHHVYACTSDDPHTARFNESFYSFLPRAILFTFINAWRIERQRLKKRNIGIISLKNRLVTFIFLQTLLLLAILSTLGATALLFFLIQGIIAIGLLHITNYLQHYGLLRRQTGPGKFERVGEHHAWRTIKAADGLNLFQLDNHADHHMHPNRSYEDLVSHDGSPEMPAGYSLMILIAFLPPIWFSIMNKRLLGVRGDFISNRRNR